MALVVDASALIVAIVGRSREASALRRRLADEVCHAPHLIDAEVGNVLRRRVLRRELGAAAAERLLLAGAPLIDHRHEMTGGLAAAAWALHRNLSFYDALYAGLATVLQAPMLTADERLGRAPGLGCTAELVASD